MSNKQSSVELFAIALYESGHLQGSWNKIKDLLKGYKALHKEEIDESYSEGYQDGHEVAEQYYNETFGGNNEQ
jgi:hypothetical protein